MTVNEAAALDPASYYADLTELYERYGEEIHGWHYGVWDAGVTSHLQSLLRSNEILLEGLRIGPETRILDVGFGSGGFSIWAARTFGCELTGITVCAEHVELATERAHASAVGDRCRFLIMDMDRLDLGEGEFDVVVNQDTFCHAAEKKSYLANLQRLLRPAGWWRAIDFSIQSEPLSRAEEKEHRLVLEGFHIPSLASERSVDEMLQDLGYEDVESRDLTERVDPSARHILRQCHLPRLMAHLHLDWIVYSRDPVRRRNRRGHVAAGMAYSRGLLRRTFRHCYYSARNPGSCSVGR